MRISDDMKSLVHGSTKKFKHSLNWIQRQLTQQLTAPPDGKVCGWVSAWDLTNVTAEDVNEPAAEGLVLTRLLQAHRRPAPEVELALNSACDIINYAALDVCPACELLDGSRGQRTLQIPLNLTPPVPCRHLQR